MFDLIPENPIGPEAILEKKKKYIMPCLNWMKKKELIKQTYSYDEIVVDLNK